MNLVAASRGMEIETGIEPVSIVFWRYRTFIVPCFALSLAMALGGCSVLPGFRGVSIAYQSPDTIGVKYDHLQSAASIVSGRSPDDYEQEAMNVISSHCGNKYRITGRSHERGYTIIDAVCQ